MKDDPFNCYYCGGTGKLDSPVPVGKVGDNIPHDFVHGSTLYRYGEEVECRECHGWGKV